MSEQQSEGTATETQQSDNTPDDNGGEHKGNNGFTPPESQEELNRIIRERVQRERQKYADYSDLKAKAAKLQEIEDSQRSESEKQAERITAAERRAQEAETALARFQVALEKGLTPSQAKRLVGSSREELEADADELLKDLGDANKPRSPRPDPTQGKQQATPLDPRAADLAQIEADIAAGRRR